MGMYNVSENYKTQIKKGTRNKSECRVNLGVVNVTAKDASSFLTNSELHLSELDNIKENIESSFRYATLEHNVFVLDGNRVLPPTPLEPIAHHQGYISEILSDINTEFPSGSEPYIRIDFTEPLDFVGLSFTFDTIDYNFPTDMDINTYLSGTPIQSLNIQPRESQYVLETPLEFCDRIDLIFNKTSLPYRRARLESLGFGVIKRFDGNNLIKSVWENEIDLLSSKLPKEMFSFTAYDINKEYVPENAQGIWKYVEEQQPVSFDYGYTLDDGSVEWVKGGNYLTSGEIKSDSQNNLSVVTFNTTSEISQSTGTAYKGVYRSTPITLYQMLINVLDHAGIVNYEIDTDLQDITTTLPLPPVPFREGVQIIANAGRAVVYTDRTGKLIVRRIDGLLTDFKLGKSDIKTNPIMDKVPMLSKVETYYSTLQIDSDKVDLVKKENITYSVPTEIRLTYDEATELQVTTSGLTVHGTPELYAHSCVVVVSGTGTIIIKGKKLNRAKVRLILEVNDKGYICPIENPMIDNHDDALLYAEWVRDILELRNIYSVDNKGFPELDVLDKILVDTLFNEDLEARVFYNKIEYNGAISGTTKYISLGVS